MKYHRLLEKLYLPYSTGILDIGFILGVVFKAEYIFEGWQNQ